MSHIWRDHQRVIDAYQLLGREKVEKLGYSTKYVDRELIKCSDKPQTAKIAEMLGKEITILPQVRFDDDIKKLLSEINRTATDIKEFCEVKRTTKDGKEVFRILNFK